LVSWIIKGFTAQLTDDGIKVGRLCSMNARTEKDTINH